MDDLFERWLNNKDSKLIKIALTDKSYKNYYQRKHKAEYKGKTNNDLSTLGDAVISLCYIDLLYGDCKELSEERKKYVTDKVIVSVVAKHYGLINYINRDKDDKIIPNDYDYKKGKRSRHKYIATAVEAVIGAMYKEGVALENIKELLKEWKNLVDNDPRFNNHN